MELRVDLPQNGDPAGVKGFKTPLGLDPELKNELLTETSQNTAMRSECTVFHPNSKARSGLSFARADGEIAVDCSSWDTDLAGFWS